MLFVRLCFSGGTVPCREEIDGIPDVLYSSPHVEAHVLSLGKQKVTEAKMLATVVLYGGVAACGVCHQWFVGGD